MRIRRLSLKRLLAAGLALHLHAKGLWLSLWKRRPVHPHDAWACTSPREAFRSCHALPPCQRASCRYTRQYCEENIWHLCEDFLRGRTGRNGRRGKPLLPRSRTDSDRLKVVFVSNDDKSVPFWNMRFGRLCNRTGVQGFLRWDYHVFAILEVRGSRNRTCVVYDLDTNNEMQFPMPFEDYVENVLRPRCLELADCPRDRLFRVIQADDYLDCLCSDRSHMLLEDGCYRAIQPKEPRIMGPRIRMGNRLTNLLQDFVSMDAEVGVGQVLEEKEFVQRFFRDDQRQAEYGHA